MFYEAIDFNQDIGRWLTSNVTNMSYMFYDAYNFDQDIGDWMTDNVNDMSCMFVDASHFNQDISRWLTSNVTDMSDMFFNAQAFNQDISQWSTDNIDDVDEIDGIICSTALYTRLNGESWTNKDVMKMLFPYKRRKDFLKFLVESGYIPYQGSCLTASHHKIFSKEDINRIIMSFL